MLPVPAFSSETARTIAEVGLAFVAVSAGLMTTVIVPTVVRVGPALFAHALPFLTARITDARKRRIAVALGRAISRAVAVYSAAYRAAEKLAQAASSPGGVEVTPDEREACMRKAWLAVVEDLKRDGAWAELVADMGGEQALLEHLTAAVFTQAHGSPIGATSLKAYTLDGIVR